MKINDCYIKFEASEHGDGFTSTIREDLGTGSRNWNKWYGHLLGVAKNFEPKTEWEAVVKVRLRAQGVKFV